MKRLLLLQHSLRTDQPLYYSVSPLWPADLAAMNRDQEEMEGGPDHAAHLAAMWAGQSNVIVAVRIRPVG